MLRLFDLVWQLLKWALWLTLVRLLTSAFGWEFGVSRQYLRLLEWLLQLGQERIARVESEQRLNQLDEEDGRLSPIGCDKSTTTTTTTDHKQEGRLETTPPSMLAVLGEDGKPQDGLAKPADLAGVAPDGRQRKVSILRGHTEHWAGVANGQAAGATQTTANGHSKLTLQTSSSSFIQQQEQQRKRRVSTPDGPPVFLLDDESDDDDDDSENNKNGQTVVESTTAAATTLKGNHYVRQSNGHHSHKHEFHLEDATRFVVKGVSAICDDEVTKRFTPEQLKTWNLLTRTNDKNYQFMSRSLGLYWFSGLLIRYVILMPLRIMFTLTGTIWLVCSMTLIGLLVPRTLRNKPFRLMSLMSFRMLSCGITSRLRFHNRQFRARGGDICVANHTSPIDVVLLACDNCYALVGQRHGGLLGLLEMALSRATNHVWFDRGEMRDRQLVTQRLKEHVSVKSNLPVLIFPEGTCINNSAVMMFRKGSFETSARICPAAIKYDSRFGDPFWNSSKQSYLEYLLMMMSSWAIKCDVWYLPPMERLAGESPAEFANRVKAEIAKQGGLEDLAWDGQLKRSSVKPTWLYQQQEDYVKRLKLE